MWPRRQPAALCDAPSRALPCDPGSTRTTRFGGKPTRTAGAPAPRSGSGAAGTHRAHDLSRQRPSGASPRPSVTPRSVTTASDEVSAWRGRSCPPAWRAMSVKRETRWGCRPGRTNWSPRWCACCWRRTTTSSSPIVPTVSGPAGAATPHSVRWSTSGRERTGSSRERQRDRVSQTARGPPRGAAATAAGTKSNRSRRGSGSSCVTNSSWNCHRRRR